MCASREDVEPGWVPLPAPSAEPSDDGAAAPLSQDAHQGHDPHSVQVLGSPAGGELGCGAAAERRGHAGQGQGRQGGGDGAALASLGQVEGLRAAAGQARLRLLSPELRGLLLERPEKEAAAASPSAPPGPRGGGPRGRLSTPPQRTAPRLPGSGLMCPSPHSNESGVQPAGRVRVPGPLLTARLPSRQPEVYIPTHRTPDGSTDGTARLVAESGGDAGGTPRGCERVPRTHTTVPGSSSGP